MYTFIKVGFLVILFSCLAFPQNSWEFTGGPYCGAATVMATNSSGHVFAGTATGVYRSTDNGDHWIRVTQGLGVVNVTAMTVSSIGSIIIILSNGDIYRSVNNGDTWELIRQVALPMVNASLSFACNSSGDIFMGIDSSGVYRSTNDGDTWEDINKGLPSTRVQALAVRTNGDLYAGMLKGLYFSTDKGDNWAEITLDTLLFDGVRSNGIVVRSNGDLFVLGWNSLLSKSTDHGTTWKGVSYKIDSVQFPPGRGRWRIIVTEKTIPYSFLIDSIGNIIVNDNIGGYAYGALSRSTDNGETWKTMLMNVPPQYIGDIAEYLFLWGDSLYIGVPRSLTLSSDGSIFAGTDKGGIFRLQKNDTLWTPVIRELASKPVYSMVTNSHGKVLLLNEGGFFRSSQSGDHWMRKNANFINSNYSGIAINQNGKIFVAHDTLYRSTDEGDHWDTCGTMWNKMSVAISPNGYIFAGGSYTPLECSTDDGDSWHYPAATLMSNSTLITGTGGNVYSYDVGVFSRSTDYGITWTEESFNYEMISLAANRDSILFAGQTTEHSRQAPAQCN